MACGVANTAGKLPEWPPCPVIFPPIRSLRSTVSTSPMCHHPCSPAIC
ncbi:unnamed protein product [Chondrus crispus]|uniref:Uncharacterized protein n=1 Tax=Chondrus crispus TaxID=2769 RepID=S0F395_CHOCR|nr:unnamed protein product [Chondrus crispus]CDF77587.1 unnamed protein product [Chondrus crispus]|eukprot:XP_005718271.1 unnamed protein product [Chondrus crispus]